ncbi:MAG: SusC/RagA family TonB-linked outer membrane protein [Muribaculaceae bacterium]|nr:SusC/RagA family TonB-linked outer membrane protein [Muribaculaceae bacterium]
MKKQLILMLTMLLATIAATAQITKMSGTVVSDDDGLPIFGATVTVTGTQTIAITDIDGKFTLNGLTAKDKTITVTFVGMAPQTVKIAPEVTVVMIPTDADLDEVMVVAFGKQKREAFTGSASVVDAAQIERLQVTNPIEALNGNVTGMSMIESNSFTSDPTINIRGLSSINASNSPLIVLDGLPYNGYWNDINPADVASITVLKDAASNALYGARGANGVILITSKAAQRGKTKVTIEAKWGANSNARVDYNTISDPGQYYEAHYAALRNYYINGQNMSAAAAHQQANSVLTGPFANGGLGYNVFAVPNGEYLIGSNGKLNPNATLGNRVAYNGNIYTLLPDDWSKAGLRTGFREEYNVRLTGGNNQFSFLSSLGYLKEDGLAYNNDIERLTARLKAEYQAYSFLKIGANAGYNHTHTNSADNVFTVPVSIAPIYPLYVRDGEGNILTDNHGRVYDYGSGNNAGMMRPVDTNGNYIQDDLLDVASNSSNAFNIQGYANFDFLKHFRLTVNGSVYITENRMRSAYNPYYGYTATTGGSTEISHYRTSDYNYQQLLSYTNSFGLNNIDILLGHEYSRSQQTSLKASKNKIAMFETNIELNGAIIDGSMSSYITNYNVEGYFLRAQYDYDNRIFGSFSFRRDGSSRFHPDHRWGNFWSLGAAWILTRESWFPKTTWLDMLKVKASYGEQGNDGIGNYRYVDTYTIKNSDGEIAFVFNNKGNPNITWETVGSFNAGFEADLFNSRLNIDLEGYVRTTRNMLMWLTVPVSLGYEGYYDNIGNMRNSGLELSISGDIIASRNFAWNLGINFTWEKNRITYLPESKRSLVVDGYGGYADGSVFYGEGLPMRTWYLKEYAGVSSEGEALFYKTVNGEKVTTTNYEDATYYNCGSALPDMFGGINTSLRIYDFDLNVQLNYSIGGKKFDSNYQFLMTPPWSSLTGSPMHQDVFNSWSLTNQSSDIPRWQYNDDESALSSSRWLTNASFISLRNISVGYNFPKSITSRLKMEKMRLFVSADNIYYWSHRKGFDPRMGTYYGNYNADSGYSFPRRTISGGIQINF